MFRFLPPGLEEAFHVIISRVTFIAIVNKHSPAILNPDGLPENEGKRRASLEKP